MGTCCATGKHLPKRDKITYIVPQCSRLTI